MRDDMSDRNRRIFSWVLAAGGVLTLAYVGVVIVLIARGELEAGPLRLVTVALNLVTGVLLVGSAVLFGRMGQRRG